MNEWLKQTNIRGPQGVQGERGGTWYEGDDYPINLPDQDRFIDGDMYLKAIDPNGGTVWRFQGSTRQWLYSGTDITGPKGDEGPQGEQGPPGPPGTTDWNGIVNKPSTFPPTLPIPQSGVTNLMTDLANIQAEQNVQNNRLNGVENVNSQQTTAINLRITDAPVDGKQYVRKNAAWNEVAVPPGTYIGDTPPASPQPGQLWWESDTGNLYIWYNDGNSSQWVQVNAIAGPSNPPTALPTNRIVNGAMLISQENGTNAGSTSGYFLADMWQGSQNGITVNTWQRQKDPTYGHYQLAGQCAAKASLASGDYLMFLHSFEGLQIADFMWGTALARPAVLRFDCYTSVAGTFGIGLRSAAGGRSFVSNFVSAANQWQTFTFAIPGDTSHLWNTDNTRGGELDIIFAAGSSVTAPAPGWHNAGYVGVTGMTNGAATGGTFYIKNVGLYLDPDGTGLPPKWEVPNNAEELQACQRYWQKLQVVFSGQVTSGQNYYGQIAIPVPFRAAPTFTGANVFVVGFANTAGTPEFRAINLVTEYRTANATANGIFQTNWTCNARM